MAVRNGGARGRSQAHTTDDLTWTAELRAAVEEYADQPWEANEPVRPPAVRRRDLRQQQSTSSRSETPSHGAQSATEADGAWRVSPRRRPDDSMGLPMPDTAAARSPLAVPPHASTPDPLTSPTGVLPVRGRRAQVGVPTPDPLTSPTGVLPVRGRRAGAPDEVADAPTTVQAPVTGQWGHIGEQVHVPATGALPTRRQQRARSSAADERRGRGDGRDDGRRTATAPAGRPSRRGRLVKGLAVVAALVAAVGAVQFGTSLIGQTPDRDATAGTELDAALVSQEGVSRPFAPKVDGTVGGVRFLHPATTGVRYDTGLWASDGTLLAQGQSSPDSARGWQTAWFTKPLPVKAGQRYTASYWRHRDGVKPRPPRTTTRSAGPSTGTGGGSSVTVPATDVSDGTTPSISTPPADGVQVPPVDVVFDPAPSQSSSSATSVTSSNKPTSSTSSAPSSSSSASQPSGGGSGTNPGGSATGCLAKPSSCGYPDATNTGVPSGVTLTSSGSLNITKDGTVVDAKLITGSIMIRADNVTIKRSKVVMSGGGSGSSVIRVFEGYTGALIQDVEVDGRNSCGIAVELAGDGGTAQRVEAYGCADYYRANGGTTIVDSYGHDRWAAPGAHSDGIQSLGVSNLTYRHNTLVLPGDSGVNALIMVGDEYGTPRNVKIENNLLDGGGYTLRIAPGASGISVTGNRFGRDYSYGPFYMTGASYSWSGNVWDSSGASLSD